jgi:hypothetical protein
MAYRINPNIYKMVLDDVRKALSNKNLLTSDVETLLRDCELANIANRDASKHSSNSELIFMLDSCSEEEEDVEPSSHSTVWCIDSEDESSENEFAE